MRVAMVVDDSRVARAYLTRILRGLGFQVAEAEDGDVALELLECMPEPDFLFVDRHMPRMDGLELVRRVRQQLGLRDVVIVMVTSDNKPETVAEALEAGADEYVMKPYTEDVIQSKLALVLEEQQ